MRWFRNMKIQSKLFLIFGTLVLFMVFSSVFSCWLLITSSLTAVKQVFAIIAGIIAFSLFLSILMARSIKEPIVRIQTAMAEISKGNLAYPIRSDAKDELGKLSNAIGDMVDHISDINKTVAFMDYLDCMILIVTLDYRILYMNEKMAEAYKVDRKDSINQKCYKALHGYEQSCPHCLWPRTLSAQEQNKVSERERFWDEDLCKWLGGKAAIIRWVDGSLVQFYYISDETVKHNYEMKLEEEAHAAEMASLSKSVFLANMSHEIRTPMNAILGITEIQLENVSLPLETREALSKIYNSGDLLLGIINDILDMSKIEAGKLEVMPSKYGVASLINDTVQLNMMRFESKPIDFKLYVDEAIPSQLVGDEIRIKQILNNLLSNAAKYTKSGEVVFSVNFERGNIDESVMLILKISDTGQGMTAEQLSKLFDAYSRFNMDVNRTIEGTGLGMNITSKLVDMMNGEIIVESEPDKGSVFTVRLPQGSTGAASLGKKGAENLQQFRFNSISHKAKLQILREPMPYGRVLVVDDVEANLYVAKGLLMSYKLQIETAESGFETIDKIKAGGKYDIIFMDQMMPKMDGIETVQNIRSLGYTLPIVALTANAVMGQSDTFIENGFDDFISKPIDMRSLSFLLHRYIRDKQPPEVLAAAWQWQNGQQANDASGNPDWIDQLVGELSRIEGLDVGAGLAYTGHNWESYFMVLRYFAENCDSYIDELQRTVKIEAWNEYVIKVHTLKSIFAAFGLKELSLWAKRLEKASKASDDGFSPVICHAETAPFCRDLSEFRDNLQQTSLMTIPTDEVKKEKPKGDMEFLKAQLEHLKEACRKYSFGDTKKVIAVIEEYEWDGETGERVDEICHFVLTFDYDKALGEINTLLR